MGLSVLVLDARVEPLIVVWETKIGIRKHDRGLKTNHVMPPAYRDEQHLSRAQYNFHWPHLPIKRMLGVVRSTTINLRIYSNSVVYIWGLLRRDEQELLSSIHLGNQHVHHVMMQGS